MLTQPGEPFITPIATKRKNVVAIMQPTYLPWMGLLSMIDQADLFILLDTVPLDTKSWQTRNRILARDNNVIWLTIPVHARRDDLIKDVEIANQHNWQAKHTRAIQSAYGHCNHADKLEPILQAIRPHQDKLAELTARTTRTLCQTLGIDTPIINATTVTGKDRIERIGQICADHQATAFLATPGSTFLNGLDEISKGIPIQWHHYQPREYKQNRGPFISHLSTIDSLARHGPARTLQLIRAGKTK